jgi:hypothetical protein
LSLGSCGIGRVEALCASSPKVARRPDGGCERTPFSTRISETGAFHWNAAAARSISLAAAPAFRIWVQELAMAVEPPVPWTGPNRRLL